MLKKKKKGGKGLVIVLAILVVLLLGAVGALGYFMYAKGMFDPQAQQAAAAAPAPAAQQQASSTPEEEQGEKFLASIDNLVLNVSDAKGRSKLMKLSFTMKTIEPTIPQIVEINKAQITDSVIRQISARSSEELMTVGGKEMLKEEMIEEINKIINDSIGEQEIKKDCVKDIYFTSFVIK